MSAAVLTESEAVAVAEIDRKPENALVRAGLLRRLAAAWVDGFVVYAAASFLIAVTALAGVRLALGPAILILGMGYGSVSLGYFGGRTFGKVLWGMAVARRDGGPPGWTEIALREALGKWGILGCAPGIVGRLILGPSWVPTAYDLVAVIPLIVLTGFLYLVFRKTWYDQLAGTVVVRRPAAPGAVRNALALLLGVAVLGGAVKFGERLSLGTLPSRTLLYYGRGPSRAQQDFVKRAAVSPNDYIFGLFDRYDLVVLCERDHSEATQWDFIYDLVKDPRFSDRVGHVFTELGQTGMQARLDAFMADDGLSQAEIHERALDILRHWSVWPVWQRVNFPTYLERLYALNQSLPPARRIQHHFTDIAVDWPNLTQEKMSAHWRSLGRRDQQMAQVIIDQLKALETTHGKPAKGLVIMNFRHAFDLTGGSPAAARYNTCEFLRDALPGRVANVRINEDFLWPVAGGRWNQAFTKNGNRPAGFDLAGSPFGSEPFDLFPWAPALRGRLKYQDVFTGFLFINPPSAQYLLDGIPGYYRGWESEMRRRAQLFGEDWVKTVDQGIALERQGRVPLKAPHVVFRIESYVAVGIACFFAIGLGLGLTAFGLRKRIQAPVLASDPPAPAGRVRRVSARLWLLFAGAIVLSVFVHELGHCAVAWVNGAPAVPTPAKEYLLGPLPAGARNAMSLGGVLGSIACLLGAGYWLFRRPDAMRSALFAGAMTLPGFYVLRFFLVGRGHDATEFQEAQAAVGMSYSGHGLDWVFVVLFALAAVGWCWRMRPALSWRLLPRAIAGAVLGLVVLIVLQIGNNALFDPLLEHHESPPTPNEGAQNSPMRH